MAFLWLWSERCWHPGSSAQQGPPLAASRAGAGASWLEGPLQSGAHRGLWGTTAPWETAISVITDQAEGQPQKMSPNASETQDVYGHLDCVDTSAFLLQVLTIPFQTGQALRFLANWEGKDLHALKILRLVLKPIFRYLESSFRVSDTSCLSHCKQLIEQSKLCVKPGVGLDVRTALERKQSGLNFCILLQVNTISA